MTRCGESLSSWLLAITSLGLPERLHRARADRAVQSSLGRVGDVVRQPSHGRHSPQPLLPDTHRLGVPGASPRCRWPAAADAGPRSRGPNLSSAGLLAPGQGPDPGLKSAAGALSSPGRRRPRLRLPDRGYHHCTSPSWQVLRLTTSTPSQRRGSHPWGLVDPWLNLCSTRRGGVGRPPGRQTPT